MASIILPRRWLAAPADPTSLVLRDDGPLGGATGYAIPAGRNWLTAYGPVTAGSNDLRVDSNNAGAALLDSYGITTLRMERGAPRKNDFTLLFLGSRPATSTNQTQLFRTVSGGWYALALGQGMVNGTLQARSNGTSFLQTADVPVPIGDTPYAAVLWRSAAGIGINVGGVSSLASGTQDTDAFIAIRSDGNQPDKTNLIAYWPQVLSAEQIAEAQANPWQVFRPRRRVLYFDVGAGGGITVAVNQSTETDTAQAINKVKLKAVGQATETDTVQAFTTSKLKAVGQATETDTVQAFTTSKLREVGQATETDTVQAFTTSKLREVGQVVETNTAQNITPSGPKLIAVGQASETDFAQAVAKAKALGILQPVETDSAHSITRVKARAIGQVVDTSEAQPVTAVGGATPTLSPEDIASIAAAVWAHSTAVDAHAKLDAILARLQC